MFIILQCSLQLFKMIYFLQKAISHPADLKLRYSTEAGVEVQMFSACQQLIYGIKLWAVSHVLVDVQDVGQNAEDLGENTWGKH